MFFQFREFIARRFNSTLMSVVSDKNYSLILGDFNCAIQKNLDGNPPQQLDDIPGISPRIPKHVT